MGTRYFTSDTLDFLQDLEVNNDREWFDANRARYEDEVRGPMLAFIGDLAEPLHRRISPHLTADARKQGGSLFRIHRDVRFSTDKSPYKTNTGAFFRHEAGKHQAAPGLYLHLEPGNCFMGAGVYMPPSDVLRTLRTAMVEDPDRWTAVRDAPELQDWVFGGDSLKRAPKGFAADHPLLTDLCRTSCIVSRPIAEKELTSATFLDGFVDRGVQTAGLMGWIAGALGLPF